MNSKCTLFVGDLTTQCTEHDLEKVFSMVGMVRHVRIQRAQGSQNSLGYGFVKMSSHAAATKAMTSLDGYLLFGRKLRVRFAGYRLGNNSEEKKQPTNCLYVKFVGQVQGACTNEEKIREIYSRYGDEEIIIEDIIIRKSAIDKRSGCQKGYGFIQFCDTTAGTMSAVTIINHLSSLQVDSVAYSIEVSKELQEHLVGSGLIKFVTNPVASLAGVLGYDSKYVISSCAGKGGKGQGNEKSGRSKNRGQSAHGGDAGSRTAAGHNTKGFPSGAASLQGAVRTPSAHMHVTDEATPTLYYTPQSATMPVYSDGMSGDYGYAYPSPAEVANSGLGSEYLADGESHATISHRSPGGVATVSSSSTCTSDNSNDHLFMLMSQDSSVRSAGRTSEVEQAPTLTLADKHVVTLAPALAGIQQLRDTITPTFNSLQSLVGSGYETLKQSLNMGVNPGSVDFPQTQSVTDQAAHLARYSENINMNTLTEPSEQQQFSYLSNLEAMRKSGMHPTLGHGLGPNNSVESMNEVAQPIFSSFGEVVNPEGGATLPMGDKYGGYGGQNLEADAYSEKVKPIKPTKYFLL